MSTGACSVCGVEYGEDYEGPCQEFAPSASDEQIKRGTPPMCPGRVALGATLERRIGVLAALLGEALNILEEEPQTAASVVAQGLIRRGRGVLRGNCSHTSEEEG